jgi:hypothetical protein
MKKVVHCLFAFSIIANASAQYIQKIDVVPYFAKVPTPPSTAKECYDKATYSNGSFNIDNVFKAPKDEIETIIKNINTPNEAFKQNANNVKSLTDQMQKDNVQSMTDDQKMEYMKTHGQNVQGMPSQGRIDFAEKLKDPAFKAQFEKMSPQEKMAYMQNNGVMNTNKAVSIAPVVATNAVNAGQKMALDYQNISARQVRELQQVSDSAKMNHEAIDKEKMTELKKLPTHVVGEGGEEYNEPQKAKAIEQKYWNKHMEFVQKEINRYKQLLTKHTQEWKDAVGSYNSELAKIHYGDDIQNEVEMKQKDMLASYQSQMFAYS